MAEKWSRFVEELLEGTESDPRERRKLADTATLLRAAVEQIRVPSTYEESSRERALAEMKIEFRREHATRRLWSPFAPALRVVMGFFRWRP
jgi:hypothetical protein